jgi:hypothetical protein
MMILEGRVAQFVQADAAAPPNTSFDPALYSCYLVFGLRCKYVSRPNAPPSPPRVE